ncbi:MAG TPA: HlyD family secretion protein [Tepidisphaeraceae bacterium]|jgi:membrane fusion protein (multidrug efflux system)|nr:HlyD family secretion protein [Tepidisphaeraceae bacterium]
MASEETVVETVTPLSGRDAGETYMTPPAPQSVMPTDGRAKRSRRRKRWIIISLVVAGVALGLIFGVPEAIYAWNHVSTDDAIVNSHITYISSRVSGLAREVLVDDNQYVEAGTPMIRIDRVPYQLAVEQRTAELGRAKLGVAEKVAALDLAEAQLDRVRSEVRSKIADLRGDWYLVATVGDFVKYEMAALQGGVANLHQQEANLKLAQQEYARVKKLGPQSVSQEEIDQRSSALQVAQAQVASAQASVDQTRALLGLPPNPKDPGSVPADVGQTFNGMQYAASSVMGALAQLGLNFQSISSPKLMEMKEHFSALSVDSVVENSPAVKAAKAQVASAQAALGGAHFDRSHPDLQPEIVEAQKGLEQAQLQLSYTDIRAPLSGYIGRRNVNPGTLVAVGQPLLTIRPLSDVWVDANFKETQLADLCIGQKVDIYVDAYSDKVFHGRIAGFSPGTGAVMSLLPPENATGNFVKVVQRLPVRIDLTEPNPADTPLMAGFSVVPEVDIRLQPEGPDAGRRLLGGAQGQ